MEGKYEIIQQNDSPTLLTRELNSIVLESFLRSSFWEKTKYRKEKKERFSYFGKPYFFACVLCEDAVLLVLQQIKILVALWNVL